MRQLVARPTSTAPGETAATSSVQNPLIDPGPDGTAAAVPDYKSMLKAAQEEVEILKQALMEVLDCYASRVKELEDENAIMHCQVESSRENRKRNFPELISRMAEMSNAGHNVELSEAFTELVTLFTDQEQDNIRLMAQVESLSQMATARQEELDVLYDQQVQDLTRQFEQDLTPLTRQNSSHQLQELCQRSIPDGDRKNVTPPTRSPVASRVRPATATSRMQRSATVKSRRASLAKPAAKFGQHRQKRPASAKLRGVHTSGWELCHKNKADDGLSGSIHVCKSPMSSQGDRSLRAGDGGFSRPASRTSPQRSRSPSSKSPSTNAHDLQCKSPNPIQHRWVMIDGVATQTRMVHDSRGQPHTNLVNLILNN